jgi:hypothetical protein
MIPAENAVDDVTAPATLAAAKENMSATGATARGSFQTRTSLCGRSVLYCTICEGRGKITGLFTGHPIPLERSVIRSWTE